ncbi:MAG: asparagine synthase (glutamine-hydrolyzing) [Clostridia bacterium]|nr:asparagine synthase (glutamine-hydrolyzing) [Clostridia bacterium]
MCSICAIADFRNNENLNPGTLTVMGRTMKHRGPDDTGVYLSKNVLMHHNRLSVMDVNGGKQPMSVSSGEKKYTIIYNGEIYNTDELKEELSLSGAIFNTKCDTEVVLWSYIKWKDKCVEKLNGIFSFVIYDEEECRLFMARDRFGVKPFFYSFVGSTLLIASEIKAILAHPAIKPKVDKTGLWQLLFLSPVTLNSSTVFRDIYELSPGEMACFDRFGLSIKKYWQLMAKPFSDSREAAIYKTKELLCDAVRRQVRSDVPLCEFLSGGLDSSAITAIASKYARENNETCFTYSFEYEGNRESLKSNMFQPQRDDEFDERTADFLFTDHMVLTASANEVENALCASVDARDFPGQADVDSSLLYYCKQVKKRHTVALSGECSDEIFGGYPWFYSSEMLNRDFFPWIHNPYVRSGLFKNDIAMANDGYRYICEKYREDKESYSLYDDDSEDMKNSRIATNLSVNFFMTSLLERNDRMSMASGVEVRVPFADHHLAEYVYNVPWNIKHENNTEKALLINAMKDYLPAFITQRKKSSYSKSHNPEYEKTVIGLLEKELLKKGSLFYEIADRKNIDKMLSSGGDTWFGQFMTKPQLIAWLVQFAYWLEKYNVVLV